MAVLGGEMVHLTDGFTEDPGRHGVVACFVVLPYTKVEELRARLDVEIERYMEEGGYGVLKRHLQIY